MTNRVQVLRSSAPGVMPVAGTRQPGELFLNFADFALGFIDASQTAQKILAVRWFVPTTSYAVGDFVLQGGNLYRAIAPSSAGAFVAANWSKVGTAADLTAMQAYVDAGDAARLLLDGGTLTGALILAADPSVALGAATKQYADTKLALAGGTMTGALILSGTPTQPLQAATKAYVDSGAFLPIGGGTLTGPLTLAADPGAALGAATKQYVDTTAAQITASLGGYLPLAGGTVTGSLIVNGNIASNSGAIFPNLNANSSSKLQGSATETSIYFNSNTFVSAQSGATYLVTNGYNCKWDGNVFVINGGCTMRAGGYAIRPGASGAIGANAFNFNWTGSLTAWIDTSNVGTVTLTSDYRTKKNIAPLKGMWETIKALKPITYEHRDFIPPWGKPPEGEDTVEPLIVADGVERWGFVAHELQETLIESAATGRKDQENLIQSPNPWTVIAALTKALQEAMERIEALETAR